MMLELGDCADVKANLSRFVPEVRPQRAVKSVNVGMATVENAIPAANAAVLAPRISR